VYRPSRLTGIPPRAHLRTVAGVKPRNLAISFHPFSCSGDRALRFDFAMTANSILNAAGKFTFAIGLPIIGEGVTSAERMSETTVNNDLDRFRKGAAKYAAYLGTPEGQLRVDLAFANLQDFFPPNTRSLRALDIGAGTGAIAVRLARLGIHVALLDSSEEMLNIAERGAREAGVMDRIALKCGDLTQCADLVDAGSFDVILCHNVLEFVDDPSAVLRSAVRALRGPSSILSVLVRNQAGDVLKAAIRDGNLSAAEHNLTAEWGIESLYGGRVRLFRSDSLHAMLKAARLETIAERGVRIIADYLPPGVSRSAEYDRIFELERKLGRRLEFATVARYTQCIAHAASDANENGA
jgi:S-adenosylmethionine-dependent methyltransferase